VSGSSVSKGPTFVIPNGQTNSNIVDVSRSLGDAAAFLLVNQAGNDAARTYRMQVSPSIPTYDQAGNLVIDPGTWVDLQDGNPYADVTLPVPGKGVIFALQAAASLMRIVASGAVTGNATFTSSKNDIF
jgi:hypothetical protein